MRKYGARMAPLKVNAKLDLEPRRTNAAGARTAATLKLDGKVAGIDVNLNANGVGDVSDARPFSAITVARSTLSGFATGSGVRVRPAINR